LQTVAELPKIAEVANSCRQLQNCQQLQKLPTIAEVANNCKNCQQLQKLPMAAVVAAIAEKGCNSGFKLVIAKNQKTVTNTNFNIRIIHMSINYTRIIRILYCDFAWDRRF